MPENMFLTSLTNRISGLLITAKINRSKILIAPEEQKEQKLLKEDIFDI